MSEQNAPTRNPGKNPSENPRLRPLEEDDYLVLTDRQAEDHAQAVRGETTVEDEDGQDDASA